MSSTKKKVKRGEDGKFVKADEVTETPISKKNSEKATRGTLDKV